jgi:hypothetical protein
VGGLSELVLPLGRSQVNWFLFPYHNKWLMILLMQRLSILVHIAEVNLLFEESHKLQVYCFCEFSMSPKFI